MQQVDDYRPTGRGHEGVGERPRGHDDQGRGDDGPHPKAPDEPAGQEHEGHFADRRCDERHRHQRFARAQVLHVQEEIAQGHRQAHAEDETDDQQRQVGPFGHQDAQPAEEARPRFGHAVVERHAQADDKDTRQQRQVDDEGPDQPIAVDDRPSQQRPRSPTNGTPQSHAAVVAACGPRPGDDAAIDQRGDGRAEGGHEQDGGQQRRQATGAADQQRRQPRPADGRQQDSAVAAGGVGGSVPERATDQARQRHQPGQQADLRAAQAQRLVIERQKGRQRRRRPVEEEVEEFGSVHRGRVTQRQRDAKTPGC